MLVLTRRVGQKLIFDCGVTIEVTDVRGDKVRLGIEAPKGIGIYREEVWVALQRDKENAVPKVSTSP
jgi:carbon storage regulator